MPRKIDIFDTTLRDGEQVPGAKLNEEQKLEIAKQLAKMKVDVIEAGFPASSPGDLEAVRRIAKEVRGPIITALARTVKEDIDILWEAIKYAERPRIHIVLGTSDIHVEKKLGMNREQAFHMGLEALKYAKSLCEEVEYSTEDASRSDFDYLCMVVESVIKAGATVVNIPDTVGYAIPEQFGDLIARIRGRVPNIHKVILSVHCHNDLGMATANTLAAIKSGANQVECTMNGIGERAGNTSLEEVVVSIKTRKDFFDAYTNIDISQIFKTSRLVSHLMGIPVQPNKAIVGANAFAHSSGIHQDGILKDRSTYEIVRPEDVGVKEHSLILTARSGRHAVRHRLEQMGYQLSDAIFEQIFQGFLSLADKKKEVADADLESLVESEISKVPEIFHFESVQTVGGNRALPLASVTLRKDGALISEAACGNGPVDAAFLCINRLTGLKVNLLSYDLNAITKGADAQGEATVKIQINGETITGRASSTDVIEASTRAYVNAINRALASKH
ncbi:MAG: 2-isopropylmalate synthase [Candidatus Tectomicrobia bacterium]|uniref:2-isopropylmalate synthase n=1 Tax=Tectimicrobiota bacterium TaxID=2528274 RepID=A0A933LQ04_UNCTE|nr:2-isopropylmalate synthase [Candidatus Tectomicrobia bacterium]